MLKSSYIFLSILMCSLLRLTHAQSFHYLYGGINVTHLIAASKVPEGNSTQGLIHLSGNYEPGTGWMAGYDHHFSLGEIFMVSVGGNFSTLKARMDYSTQPYGAGCRGCNQFDQQDRIGLFAEYKLWTVSLPITFALPVNMKRTTFFKFGGDMTWIVNDKSTWQFREVNRQFDLVNGTWFSRITSATDQNGSLEAINFQKGLSLAVFQQIDISSQKLGIEGGGRLGIDRLDDQPALNQISFFLKVGYVLFQNSH